MKFEKSAGIIVFRKEKNTPLFLLLQNSSGFFWDFPKGNIGESESEEKAAMRELEEEAGLTKIKLVPGFKERVQYWYTLGGEKIFKTLVMFLGETSEEKVRLSWEHRKYEWLPYEIAKTRLKTQKLELLEKANKFLSGSLKSWIK